VGGIRNLSAKEKEERGVTGTVQHVEPAGLISFGVRKSGYHGQVLDPDAPSKTIICAYTICPRLFVGLHNATTGKYWIRCLTPEECGAIQGFPADYAWQGAPKDKITQIGNAVPPPLATAVASLIPLATFHATPQDSKAVAVAESSDDEDE
jgi:site-specific DNA-cytosine methylase